MRTAWMYRLGALFCLIGAGCAIAVDAHYSYGWVGKEVGLNPLVTGALCLIISTISSAVGALVTNASSWLIMFSHTLETVARIESEQERFLRLIGYCVTGFFIVTMILSTYAINLYSNHYQTDSWPASFMICFASDACLMLYLPLSFMAKSAKVTTDNLDEHIKDRRKSSTRKTVVD